MKMKNKLILILTIVLAFSLTACDTAKEIVEEVVDDATYSVDGKIDQSAVLCDNEDVKITFHKAYYEKADNGVMLFMEIDNHLDQSIGMNFNEVYVNGLGFVPWQVDEVVGANKKKDIKYKLVSSDNLKAAKITTLSNLVLGGYYYFNDEESHSIEAVRVVNSKNPDLVFDRNFSGKEITINYLGGELKIVVGVDQMILNEEGQPEFHIYSENDGNVGLITDYTVVFNGDKDYAIEHCGPYLYDEDNFLESVYFEEADIDSYKGITLKDIIIKDYDENELFKLDELSISKDDLEPISYQ